jgi:anti-sigma factor RsiW
MIERHQAGKSGNLVTRRSAALTAAGLALAAVPAMWLAYRNHSVAIFREACLDHGKYLNTESEIPSSNPMVIESWFRRKTDYAVRVPSFESAELVGARLCFLKQHKAALVFYRKRGRTVSLFQLDASGISLRSLDHEVIDGRSISRGSFGGYSLAAFEDRNVAYVLVSDLRESELLEMASAAQSQDY